MMAWIYWILAGIFLIWGGLNGMAPWENESLQALTFRSLWLEGPPLLDHAYLILLLVGYGFATLALRSRNQALHNTTEIFARISLAALYFQPAWHKITNPYDFALLVKHYDMLPAPLVDLYALVAPWTWAIVGALLLIGPRTKMNAFLYTLVMISFLIALSQAAIRELPITCGCFEIEGATDKTGTSMAIVRDLVFLIPVAWIWCKGQNKWFWELFSKGSPSV
jgi:uncharacterized membrane protein YphA (DoxX/SURF4 family)